MFQVWAIQGYHFLVSENCYSRSIKGRLQGRCSGISREFTTGTVLFSRINVLFCTGCGGGAERERECRALSASQ